MKHLYLLLVCAFAGAQLITFTDPNLKAYLLTLSTANDIASVGINQYTALDANSDGEISIAETANVIGLKIDGPFTSLGGVEQFQGLQGIRC